MVKLNVHEGKLLDCSYNNQNCVGVWVVDLSVYLSFSCILSDSLTCSIVSFLISKPSQILMTSSAPLSQIFTQRESRAQAEINQF